MAIYNPFVDFNPAFTLYKYLEPEVTKIEDPLFGINDLPEGYRLSSTGNYIAPANTPEAEAFDSSYLDENAQTHYEGPAYDEGINNPTYSTKLNLQGSKKRAMEFFLSKGMEAHHAAGIVANLIAESNLNPKATNPSSGAFGYALWLGDRKKKLLSKYGNNPTEEQQLEFIWEELNSSENRALKELLKTKTVDDAVNSFMLHFERPSKKEMALSIRNRLKFGRGLLS